MDTFGKSDPFVCVLFVPGGHEEMKTKVIKKNLNPVFDEVFKCEVSLLCHPNVCFLKNLFEGFFSSCEKSDCCL